MQPVLTRPSGGTVPGDKWQRRRRGHYSNISSASGYALPSGSATKGDASPAFTRISTLLALCLGVGQRLTHVARIGDSLAADIEDDVASLEALLGGRPIRID